MPIPCGFYYYSSAGQLDVRDGDSSGSSFIVQDCLGYPGFFFPHMKLSIILSRSVRNCVRILKAFLQLNGLILQRLLDEGAEGPLTAYYASPTDPLV